MFFEWTDSGWRFTAIPLFSLLPFPIPFPPSSFFSAIFSFPSVMDCKVQIIEITQVNQLPFHNTYRFLEKDHQVRI